MTKLHLNINDRDFAEGNKYFEYSVNDVIEENTDYNMINFRILEQTSLPDCNNVYHSRYIKLEVFPKQKTFSISSTGIKDDLVEYTDLQENMLDQYFMELVSKISDLGFVSLEEIE